MTNIQTYANYREYFLNILLWAIFLLPTSMGWWKITRSLKEKAISWADWVATIISFFITIFVIIMVIIIFCVIVIGSCNFFGV